MPRLIDLTDGRFGRLVVVGLVGSLTSSPVRPTTRKHRYWRCRCDCGQTAVVSTLHLRRGNTRSCGCLHAEVNRPAANLIGQRFGRLTVLALAGSNAVGRSLARCVCDCGSAHTVQVHSLKTGNTSSCGCSRRKPQKDST